MTTIEQAKQVEQRLRKYAVTEISPWEAADIISSLITELEAAPEQSELQDAKDTIELLEMRIDQLEAPEQLEPQPLTKSQVKAILIERFGEGAELCGDDMTLVRAIELAHGIQHKPWPSKIDPDYRSVDSEQRGHIASGDCWCNPELDYKDPTTDAEVWIHKEPQ